MTQQSDGKGMNQQRFEQLVACYGADERRWPEEERQAAAAWAKSSPQAAALLQEARVVDGWLDQVPGLEPSAAARRAVLQAAPVPRVSWAERLDRWAAGLWPLGHNWQPVGALALAAVLGLATGVAMPANEAEQEVYEASELSLEEVAELGELP
jgi:hypothetical protein